MRGCANTLLEVLYGVGASLDSNPEWLFLLRHVDHTDLIASASSLALMQQQVESHALQDTRSLSSLFGIEMDEGFSAK